MNDAPSIVFPKVLEPLVPARADREGVFTALGSRILPSWFLQALSPALEGGVRLFWIDGGNAFDAYGLSRAARAAGVDPRVVLARIMLARPFNAFQLETMVCRKVPAAWRGELIVVSDPLAPFLDPDLPLDDAWKALRSVLAGLRSLRAAWVVLEPLRKAPAGREEMLKAFLEASRSVAVLVEDGGALRLEAIDKTRLDIGAALRGGNLELGKR